MKKITAFLLVILMASTVLFAGGGQSRTTSSGVTEIEFVNMSSSWRVVDFGKDPVTAKFIEKTGVTFKTSAPQGDWQQIATVWLASKDYPEMMHMNANHVIFNQYIEAGALHPINKLAEQYNYPNIINGEYLYPGTVKAWTKPDGNFYLAPNWFSEDGFGSVGQAVNVRNDIYKQFGEPVINTMDDLYRYLIRIRDANMTSPDGAKLWALTYASSDVHYLGWIANFWGSKIYRYNYFDESARNVKFMLRNPTMVSALQWLSKCLREGLLDPEALTYNGTTQGQAFNQLKHGVNIAWIWNLWTPNALGTARSPDLFYKAINAPAGNPGVQPWHAHYHLSGTSGTMITKNCKNVEAAMRFINYFLSPEGQILNFYGIEGPSMYYKDGVPYLTDRTYDRWINDRDALRDDEGIRVWDFMNNQKYNWERHQEYPQRQQDRAIANKYAFDGTIQVVTVIDALTPEGILLADLEANIIPQLTRIIQEPNDSRIEQMVRDLIVEYERKGLARLEDAWTKQYLERL